MTNTTIIDSHAHLDYPNFAGDLPDVLARANVAGVSHVITIGVKLSTSDAPKRIAETFDNVWCSVGIHPHEAGNEADSCNIDAIKAAADHPKCVAIGEAGLDYFYIPSLFIGNLSLFYFFSIIFCFYIQFNYLKKLLKLFNCKFFYLLFVSYSFNITYLNQLLINDSIKTLFFLSFFPLIFYYFLKFIRSEKAHYFFKFLLAFSYFFLNSHPTTNLMIIIAFLFFLIMNKSFFIF